MVKFTASGHGVTIIGLGLEAENIRRLQLGQPIRVKLSDLGFTGAMGATELMRTYGLEWRQLRRKWSRPAAYMPKVANAPVQET